MERPLALIVDGDAAVRAQLHKILEACEVDSVGAANADEASSVLRSRAVQLLFADPHTRGIDVPALARCAEELEPPAVWVALERDGSASDAPDAADVVRLPAHPDRVSRAVKRARRCGELMTRVRRLEQQAQRGAGLRGFVGRSSAIERLREQIQRLAHGSDPIALWGEIGSGRRFSARALHDDGPRAAAPFVTSAELVNEANDWDPSAMRQTIDAADGGTLCLEGLSRCPIARQESWQQLLSGVGEQTRLVSSFGDEPRSLVSRGRLIPALLDVVAQTTLHVPPLRDRSDDVPLLARAFVDAVCEVNRLPSIAIEREAMERLTRYGWPENVRELRNAIERAVILCSGGRIRAVDLPERVREARSGPATDAVAATRAFREAKRGVVERFERGYLIDLMRRHAGNVTAGSQQAGMLRSALQRLLRKYDIRSADFRTRGRRRRPGDARPLAE